MGMDLTHGGHLTHGSPYNRSGTLPSRVPLRRRPGHRPAGLRRHRQDRRRGAAQAASWPAPAPTRGPSTGRLCESRRQRGRLPAGRHLAPGRPGGRRPLPQPGGLAHVTTFTTHKTLIGPRAAVILTTDEEIARAIDRAIFPGEQGGPHVNNIAAMAVCFQNAATPAFKQLQAAHGGERQGAGRGPQRAGPAPGLRRHRHPHAAGRPQGHGGPQAPSPSRATWPRASWTSAAWSATRTPSPAT